MITVAHLQESLSVGYVTATAAAARININIKREHDYGVDGTFLAMAERFQGYDDNGKEEYRYVESGTKIDFQLKCTTKWEARGDKIAWSIKTQTYNDLVSRPSHMTPLMLVLMCRPPDYEDWLTSTEEQLVLRHCCYYAEIAGSPLPNENSTKLIEIPRQNVLTPTALLAQLSSVEERLAGLFA